MKQYEIQNAELKPIEAAFKTRMQLATEHKSKIADMIVNVTREHFGESIEKLDWCKPTDLIGPQICEFIINDQTLSKFKFTLNYTEFGISILICSGDETFDQFMPMLQQPLAPIAVLSIQETALKGMLKVTMENCVTGLNGTGETCQKITRFIAEYYMAITNMVRYASAGGLI